MLQILSQRLLMLADETVYKEWEDRMERDTTNSASFSVIGPRCQVTILGGAKAQTRFEAASKQSNDPSLSRVNILGSGEDKRELVRINIDVRNALCNEIEVNVGNSNLMLLALVLGNSKVKTVNGERGTDCLPTDTIFEELRGDGSYLGDMSHHKKAYVNPSHTKKIFANMKREGKDFSRRVTPLFATMMVQANQEEGVDLDILTDSQQTPITTQPSTSKPKKKQSKRKQKKDIETTKTTQALEIASLKSRVKQLEKKANKRTHKFKRLYRVGSTRRVESLNDEGLGAQEDASKHGRSIKDIGNFAKNDMTEKEHDVIPKEVSATETLTTIGIKIPVSTAAPSTTAASPPVITEVEITLA
ncbi:hypothetical protein Tco_0829567 [Tanacetum coccineum]